MNALFVLLIKLIFGLVVLIMSIITAPFVFLYVLIQVAIEINFGWYAWVAKKLKSSKHYERFNKDR